MRSIIEAYDKPEGYYAVALGRCLSRVDAQERVGLTIQKKTVDDVLKWESNTYYENKIVGRRE